MLRRLAALTLALALMMAAGLAEAYCVSVDGFAALVDENGVELIPPGTCETLFVVRENALFAGGQPGDYRLYDADGNPLGEERFSMIHDDGGPLIYRRDGVCGAMDGFGNILVVPAWTQLVSNGRDGWLAMTGDPLDERADGVLLIDARGELTETGVSTVGGLDWVRDDRMRVTTADGRWGLIDGAGATVVPTEWRHIGEISGGMAVVSADTGRGLIDADGNERLPAVYAWVERGDGIVAALTRDGVLEVYDAGDLSRRFKASGVEEAALAGGRVSAVTGEENILYSASGEAIYRAQRLASYYPGLNGQVIVADGAWGEACQKLLSPDGGEVSGAYQRILPLRGDRYAWMTMSGRTYYSDDLGALQTSWDYDSMRWGLMDGAGNELTPAEYREIIALGEDRLLLATDGELLFADMDGGVIRRWSLAESE